MEDEAYLKAIQAFERAQAEKGDAGCFAELYPALRAGAARLTVLRGFLSEEDYRSRLTGLVAISDGLPNLHNREVLDEALSRAQELTSFRPST